MATTALPQMAVAARASTARAPDFTRGAALCRGQDLHLKRDDSIAAFEGRRQPTDLRHTLAGGQPSSYLRLCRSATTGAGGRTTPSPATGALGIV